MDFPSNNDNDVAGEDEDEVSSIFQRRHSNVEGTKRLMHKTRRIEGVPQLEPIKLEDRMTRLVVEPTHACHEFEQEDKQLENKAVALLQLMISTNSHRFFKSEAVKSLLLGFFKERMFEENISDYEMLHTTREWMDGQTQELFLDWESQKNRQTYARAMEKGVKWSDYGEEDEKKDIGLELEHEVFTSLVDDILLDFHL
ncbi:hypothetical protein Ccrd_007932 [Cynara cardunculus var. scolymus]|uniref:DUF4378 domain-containing protein n=1 Tax=Cynara cardunculus var. scolymus TaxID=59895 RepID=A0A118JTA8_CYNCS|nr:hypothetical protein Ccrd_007932 [Cynara cardunculus var. scolymus]